MEYDLLHEINRLKVLNTNCYGKYLMSGDSHGCSYCSGYEDCLTQLQTFILSFIND